MLAIGYDPDQIAEAQRPTPSAGMEAEDGTTT